MREFYELVILTILAAIWYCLYINFDVAKLAWIFCGLLTIPITFVEYVFIDTGLNNAISRLMKGKENQCMVFYKYIFLLLVAAAMGPISVLIIYMSDNIIKDIIITNYIQKNGEEE